MTYVITVTYKNGNRAQWIEKQWTTAKFIFRKYPRAEIEMKYYPTEDDNE